MADIEIKLHDGKIAKGTKVLSTVDVESSDVSSGYGDDAFVYSVSGVTRVEVVSEGLKNYENEINLALNKFFNN